MAYKMVGPADPSLDVEPIPPAPPKNDADRPRWVKEDVVYKEKLGAWRTRQQFKKDHPELEGKSWL